jgi:hypothetical protein
MPGAHIESDAECIYGKIRYGYGTVQKAGNCLLFATEVHFGKYKCCNLLISNIKLKCMSQEEKHTKKTGVKKQKIQL